MLKFSDGSEVEVEGLLAPWGGPFNGSDVAGERFSAKTDFALEWFPGDRPLLFHHGLDPEAGISVVGRISEVKSTDKGLWMRAQLDAANQYYDAIKELIKKGKLGLSSGSMRHLVEVSKSGEILRWPLIEGSLTPTPANPDAEVSFAAVKAHLDAIGVDVSDDLRAVLDAAALDNLNAFDFAYIDAEGGKHLPMHDAAHARNALARFDQTSFESDAAKEKARKKLVARCKELGIEVSPEMMGGKAVDITSLIDLLLENEIPDLDAVPLVAHAEAVKTLAALFVARTKGLHERRTKEGRILSTANRSRLDSCVESMRKVCDEMQALLDSTQPPAKAGDVRRRVQAQMQALKLRALSLS